MYTRDFLPVVSKRKAKGELGYPLRFGSRDNFQRLNNTVYRLVLKTRVLSLGVLSNDAEIDIIVTSFVPWYVLDQDYGSVYVKFLAQRNIEGLMPRSLDGGV